jgi:hypothetical protein
MSRPKRALGQFLKVGRCFEYSLMAIERLPILYSIIYTKYKIVKSRRATVFSTSEAVGVNPFGWAARGGKPTILRVRSLTRRI